MMKIALSILMLSMSCFAKKSANFLPDSFKSNIKQSYKSQLSGKTRESIGYLEYKKPHNLVFSIEGNSTFTLVMNKKKSWFYQPPSIEGINGEVTISETRKNPVSEAMSLLRHGLKSNKFYKVNGTKFVKNLIIDPKFHQELGLKEMRLHFSKSKKLDFKNIQFMELFPLKKNKIKMVFENMNETVKFTKNHFNFKIPANTNINGDFTPNKKLLKKKEVKK